MTFHNAAAKNGVKIASTSGESTAVPSISANPSHSRSAASSHTTIGASPLPVVIDLTAPDQEEFRASHEAGHDASRKLTQDQMMAAFQEFRQLVHRQPDEAERVLEAIIAREGKGSLRAAIDMVAASAPHPQ